MGKRDPVEVCRLVCSGRWKKKHLASAQEQFGAEYLADALLSIFVLGEPVEGSLQTQAKAASYLRELRPRSSRPLMEILKATLPRWNLSAEDLPHYLSDSYGRKTLLQTLRDIESDSTLTSHAARSIKTIRFYLDAREPEPIEE